MTLSITDLFITLIKIIRLITCRTFDNYLPLPYGDISTSASLENMGVKEERT